MQFVKQLLKKGNTVHATIRHDGNEDLQQLKKKDKKLSIGTLDVTDPESIKVNCKRLPVTSLLNAADQAL